MHCLQGQRHLPVPSMLEPASAAGCTFLEATSGFVRKRGSSSLGEKACGAWTL